jgi:hypothetical protein
LGHIPRISTSRSASVTATPKFARRGYRTASSARSSSTTGGPSCSIAAVPCGSDPCALPFTGTTSFAKGGTGIVMVGAYMEPPGSGVGGAMRWNIGAVIGKPENTADPTACALALHTAQQTKQAARMLAPAIDLALGQCRPIATNYPLPKILAMPRVGKSGAAGLPPASRAIPRKEI